MNVSVAAAYDLTPQQLEEIYGDQTSAEGEDLAAQDRRLKRVPVADDEKLDTDLIDKQYADLAELNASLSPNATADEVAELQRRWFAQHPSPLAQDAAGGRAAAHQAGQAS
jgi:hypothetical protein